MKSGTADQSSVTDAGCDDRRSTWRQHPIDWHAIEPEYFSGLLSLREIAMKHRCSHSAIANFARLHGWTEAKAKVLGKSAAHGLMIPLSGVLKTEKR